MPVRRLNPTLLQRRVAELGRQKALRDELRVLAEGAQSKFWEFIKGRMSAKLAALEEQLDGHLNMPEREVTAVLERRKVVRMLGDMVAGSEQTLESVERRIAELEEEIQERRQQLVDH